MRCTRLRHRHGIIHHLYFRVTRKNEDASNASWSLYAFSEIIKRPKRPLYGFPHTTVETIVLASGSRVRGKSPITFEHLYLLASCPTTNFRLARKTRIPTIQDLRLPITFERSHRLSRSQILRGVATGVVKLAGYHNRERGSVQRPGAETSVGIGPVCRAYLSTPQASVVPATFGSPGSPAPGSRSTP